MLAYKYREDTKEYIGTQVAQINPLEGGYLLPANCTFLKPPQVEEKQIQVFNGESWDIKKDYRNHPQVKLDDFTFSIVDYIGDPHNGYQFVADEVPEQYQEDPDRFKLVNGVFTDIYGTEEYEEIKKAKREEAFDKEFFNTSLGYIRRTVNMQFSDEKKDFLSDLLPTISMGVQAGQEVKIIAYDKPDFDEDIEDWTPYQHIETVSSEFIQECFLQLQADFGVLNRGV